MNLIRLALILFRQINVNPYLYCIDDDEKGIMFIQLNPKDLYQKYPDLYMKYLENTVTISFRKEHLPFKNCKEFDEYVGKYFGGTKEE